mmetsp:Transcript_996/g.1480  ORF Transcript_996/g.1480 Transcript_996/m.1480 type:complete len:243 (+) Transcript_996:36-764(+)
MMFGGVPLGENGASDTGAAETPKPEVSDASGLVLLATDGDAGQVKDALAAGLVDVNAQDEHGYSALMAAASYGNLSIVNELLATSGVDINLVDNDGDTALHYCRDVECMKALVAAGGNLTLKNGEDFTPLQAMEAELVEACMEDQMAEQMAEQMEKAHDLDEEKVQKMQEQTEETAEETPGVEASSNEQLEDNSDKQDENNIDDVEATHVNLENLSLEAEGDSEEILALKRVVAYLRSSATL